MLADSRGTVHPVLAVAGSKGRQGHPNPCVPSAPARTCHQPSRRAWRLNLPSSCSRGLACPFGGVRTAQLMLKQRSARSWARSATDCWACKMWGRLWQGFSCLCALMLIERGGLAQALSRFAQSALSPHLGRQLVRRDVVQVQRLQRRPGWDEFADHARGQVKGHAAIVVVFLALVDLQRLQGHQP